MKKSKFTDQQIAVALKQADIGTSYARGVPEAWHHPARVFTLEKKFTGLATEDLRGCQSLKSANKCLKLLVADLSLDKQILQDILSKKFDACSDS